MCSFSFDAPTQVSPSSPRLAGLESAAGVSPSVLRLEAGLLRWRDSFRPCVLSRLRRASSDRPDQPGPEDTLRAATAQLWSDLPLLEDAAGSFLPAAVPLVPALAALHAFLPSRARAPGRGLVRQWLGASWGGELPRLRQLAARSGVDPELVQWAGLRVLQPVLEAVSRTFAPGLASEDRGGRCPGCGGPPSLARYAGEDGAKSLWCALCDLEWRHPRIACPHCAARDAQRLGYLRVDVYRAHRLDLCSGCRRGLRAVDERALGRRADLLREEVATQYLCVIASERGYQEENPWLCARPRLPDRARRRPRAGAELTPRTEAED